MKIGIDARLYGVKHTGIGRYVQNLVIELTKLDSQNEYFIFGGEDIRQDIEGYPNFHYVRLKTKAYSVAEQLINPLVFGKYSLDLLHVPHFNAPIFYQGKLVITIHDLIKHFSSGPDTTTLPVWKYMFKKHIYKLAVQINIAKADSIITPSVYWKDYIIEQYHQPQDKVHVTYEAVSPFPTPKKADHHNFSITDKLHLEKPFIVYTGNLYPHKNIPFLIDTVNYFNQTHQHQLELVLICARDLFTNKLPHSDHVKYVGYVSDTDIVNIYQNALALVQPSLIEGFGLTGLEAMSVGLPVLSSNATCLPEIYADAALYFDPHNRQELLNQLEVLVTNPDRVKDLIKEGKKRVKDFSWSKMARETLTIYQNSL